MAPGAVQLTTIRSKATKKLLYVEAGKDFVDLLLSFIFLPLGSVAARLPASLVGMTGILDSAGRLASANHQILNVSKDSMLRPRVSLESRKCVEIPAKELLGIEVASQPAHAEQFYSCWCSVYSRIEGSICNHCKKTRTTVHNVPDTRNSGPGIAKDCPYIVTDNLEITPASAANIFDFLQSKNISSLGDLERSIVQVGPEEALKLPAAVFTSSTPLTDVIGLDNVDPEDDSE